jgi:transcriptional regulator with XRE-family HTH domain
MSAEVGRRVASRACRCRVPDLAALRAALGLTQAELAQMLRCSRTLVQEHEHARLHRCLGRAEVDFLRGYLRADPYRSLLAAAGYAHPFPEDLPTYRPED